MSIRALLSLSVAAVVALQVLQPAQAWNPLSSAGKAASKRWVKPPPPKVPATQSAVRPAAARALPAEVQYSFRNGVSQPRQLANDTVFYRYHSAANALPDQRGFVSLTNTPGYSRGAATEILSLPPGHHPTHVTAYVVPKGTVVDEGVVAGAWGRGGGGYQAVLPDVDPKWARFTTELAP